MQCNSGSAQILHIYRVHSPLFSLPSFSLSAQTIRIRHVGSVSYPNWAALCHFASYCCARLQRLLTSCGCGCQQSNPLFAQFCAPRPRPTQASHQHCLAGRQTDCALWTFSRLFANALGASVWWALWAPIHGAVNSIDPNPELWLGTCRRNPFLPPLSPCWSIGYWWWGAAACASNVPSMHIKVPANTPQPINGDGRDRRVIGERGEQGKRGQAGAEREAHTGHSARRGKFVKY